MQPIQSKIKRHGRRLMDLAALGVFVAVLFGLTLSCSPWVHDWNPQSPIWKTILVIDAEQATHLSTSLRWLLCVSYMIWSLAWLWPLLALRRLGRSLYANEALTRPVATAFLAMAHSIPLNVLLRLIAGALSSLAVELGGVREQQSFFSFDLTGLYILSIAGVCLYSVAYLMSLATEAADDSRSII